MIRIGLTGSIGMGKTTTADFFRQEGVPVYDADAAVHDLYRGDAVAPIGAAFPEAVISGVVDRGVLSRTLAQNPGKLKQLEAIVHPLVREKQQDFLEDQELAGADLVVFDIPLLFETGGEKRLDKVVVVSCDADTQRRRVLARPGWSEEKLALVLSRQMPDAEKRARADFVIDTGQGLKVAQSQVKAIVSTLRGET
ncbi:dephospho-CoA kinase [Agrobacterium vitis]|uniref:dephospho-CoA kinase n=1 Tax=Agrobacterium vitis TaxID=373 RepID=UPI000871F965|nr:dephospho-CoA kinase [Agrobacterium vitis]MCE6076292.1 dephospho-CoA kinase [Agrobacterium vitis]MCM2448894.1 dephospho-CoA kinase [Agrobacterium vitis]MCM2469988.1 dephospho-CoA kinase [Agrobacterium vitis]MUO69854.1 dephospho-CoA kinase [Agrobacterium vitis]MUO82862.1 dephospho-CoA kinase [Agrobacterium vitis]